MKIGIDISQLAYERTGVANYLRALVEHLLEVDQQNQYILFFSGLRSKAPVMKGVPGHNVSLKTFKFSPSMLDFMWNKLHVFPIENFIGDVDLFITSDWTEPPTKNAKKMTVLYDLVIYKYPEETAQKIIEVQKRKVHWVTRESDRILCISESTKKDAKEILGIADDKLSVVYPGI